MTEILEIGDHRFQKRAGPRRHRLEKFVGAFDDPSAEVRLVHDREVRVVHPPRRRRRCIAAKSAHGKAVQTPAGAVGMKLASLRWVSQPPAHVVGASSVQRTDAALPPPRKSEGC